MKTWLTSKSLLRNWQL